MSKLSCSRKGYRIVLAFSYIYQITIMAQQDVILQKRVKEWLDDYLAIKKSLIENKGYSKSDKDAFIYLAEIPAHIQFEEDTLENSCKTINSLASEIPDKELSTKLYSFHGNCSTTYKDKEKFTLFCQLLNEKEAYKNRHRKPINIEKVAQAWFTLVYTIPKSTASFTEDAQSAFMRLALLPLEAVITKMKAEEHILVLQSFANEPSTDGKLAAQIKEFTSLCQSIFYDKEQYALFHSALEKQNTLAALSKIKKEIEERERRFKEEQSKPKPSPQPKPQPKPQPNPQPIPHERTFTSFLKSNQLYIITAFTFIVAVCFFCLHSSKPDTLSTTPANLPKTEAAPTEQALPKASQPAKSPLATTPAPTSDKPMSDKELVEAGTKAYRSLKYDEALEYFEKAANNGQMLAQYNLAKMYLNGNGTSKNPQIAAQWFMKAARQGDAAAQYMIGKMYLEGQGVSKDEQQALTWLKKAAAQGNKEAISILKRY